MYNNESELFDTVKWAVNTNQILTIGFDDYTIVNYDEYDDFRVPTRIEFIIFPLKERIVIHKWDSGACQEATINFDRKHFENIYQTSIKKYERFELVRFELDTIDHDLERRFETTK